MRQGLSFIFAGLLLAAAPAGATGQGDQDDPYSLPKGGEQGLDMAVVDEDAMPQEPEQAADGLREAVPDEQWSGAPVDLVQAVNPLYTELRRAYVRYKLEWGGLPRVLIGESGPVLAKGATGERVDALRRRLGLPVPDPLLPTGFDGALEQKLKDFQAAHGLPADGKANAETVRLLNRGPDYYEQLLLLNMERARRLPAPGTANAKKYILVDAAAARLWMMDDGKVAGTMKVVVGTPASPTPMMAALMRYANVNPYWNIPPDLVRKSIAPAVLAQGPAYLKAKRYEVLDSWEDDAKVADPATVDWKAVAAGTTDLRVRQLPGQGNFMGNIKFMLPNHYGIYLHDTPAKALFGQDDRHLSNGCVRLEDARALARWVFGEMPRATSADAEQRVELKQPIPVYITYLTAGITPDGKLAFARDTYSRDQKLLARFDPLGPLTSGGGR
ncbi:L,D-transpeptidase family protein [Sphingomonas sp. KRR8]|uniref:L,D-transpeptidase family protein n=1 Tax=Sphingomonas sp. KRR8 TaxID=2942996 RepID=UPI0020216C64|nr:L,D-transpeptidase family protein [Sphingomonas sp. KRR8]URD62105.1 L,D-transpeptidase family protein [Sphingomonas sp. KRR8]